MTQGSLSSRHAKSELCSYVVIKICKVRLCPYLHGVNLVIKICKVRLYPYLHEANVVIKICKVRLCPYLHEVNVAINTLEVVEGAFSLPIDCHKKQYTVQYIAQSTGKSETLTRIILIIYVLLLLDAGGQFGMRVGIFVFVYSDHSNLNHLD